MAVIDYEKQDALARDKAFRLKIRRAVYAVALEVMTDAMVAGDETSARLRLATRSFTANAAVTDQVSHVLAAKSPYEAGDPLITDSAVHGIVNSNWTALASHNPNVTPAP